MWLIKNPSSLPNLGKELANFFHKGLPGKYFRSLSKLLNTVVTVQKAVIDNSYVNKRSCVPMKPRLQRSVAWPDLACGADP